MAVLGSHLTQTQTSLIEEYVKSLDCAVTLCVFMDSDEAGLKGNYETIRNLWKRSALRKCNINVNVITSGEKDPDEYYSKRRKEENEGIATYSVFEYLFRYHLRNEETTLAEVDIQEEYSSKTIEEKINILHKIESFLLDDEWREIIGRYHSLYAEGKQDVNVPEDFSFGLVKGYVQGENAEKYCGEEKRDYLYHMRNALQIARISYEREDIRLDEWTWDRIEICADAFFVHFYEDLLANELSPRTIQIPMIEAMTPKKLDVQRRKLIYCHEELVLQQYVLNELLSRGCYSQYEEFIPAIRYQSGRGTYMTGYGYQDIDEVVSFAYQIDMSAINGDSKIENGMYRPFYDCWKDYIQYVQDGIQRLNGNTVYRVKLDIKGFYDNIKRHIVRNALYKPFQQALRKDDSKFACFRGKDNDPDGDSCARNLLEWILSELFKTEYYSAADGKLYKKSDENCAIPQGPNLSAYIANVVLFEVDKKVYEIVKEVNAKCEEDKIVVRYCRYVDDMIIISSNPSILLCIKDVIHSTLYQLGLELSPKTDSEEGISKEEALEWTVDERGGLGVSAAFDMADDSLDSVLDECDEYDVTDRREALRLLRSTLSPMIYEGLKTEIDFMKLLEIVFKTGEIRINDIIRFSELMLYHAAENMSDIWENYVGLWKQGMQYCPSDSILWIEGMSTYVFLEGCCRILKQQNQAKQAESYSLWKKSEIKIRDTLKGVDIWQKIEEEIHEKELLKKNAWVLNLKLIELYILLGNEQTISLDVESNEYLERWLWYMKKSQKMKLAKPKHKELQRREKEENILRDYHFNTNYWKDDLNNNSLYWQSALLPVILNVDGKDEDKKRNVKILAERYKKYPSIALHEDINTIPAFEGMFKPLMKRGFISGNMEGALNDVTEVICAEMFALSSPGNYQSFLKESFNAYNNYTENSFISKGQGETGKKEKKYEDYAVSLIKDLKEFGSYISAYQEEGRANRTPIVLIPACTTRAVDYYVIGQGNYLAAGVKTVLCNSCKTTAGGGSCFIGPDSWDDRKLNKGEELLKENTIYHGLKPGIYMQTSKERCRGALGEKEQALLVCDISPYHEKNSPNIESMVDAFSIVAHIPILEEKIYVKQCIGKNKCSKKDGFVIQKEGQERAEMKNLMANIIEHCQDRGSTTTMTESDEDAEKMEEYLKRLGLHYNSDWLYKRGEYYKEFHKTKPQRGIAPTLIDWMYIEIDYQKFMEDKKQYLV